MWWHFNFKKRWQSYQKICLKNTFSSQCINIFRIFRVWLFWSFFFHISILFTSIFSVTTEMRSNILPKRKALLSTKIEFFTTFGFYRLGHFSPPPHLIPWNNFYSNSQNLIPFKKLNVYEMRLFEAKEWLYKNLIWMCSPKNHLHL